MRPLRVLLVLSALVAGCGGESGTAGDAADAAGSSTPAAPTSEGAAGASGAAADPSDLLVRYLEVFAVADAARLASEWVPMTAPGSLARLYSEHHTTFRRALEEAGTAPPRNDTVEATEDGVEICTDGPGCRTYTDATVEDGLLTSFSVNGEPLRGRVVQPGAQASAAGVTVSLVSGYETPLRALFLCVEARNGSAAPVSLNATSASYPGPDGQPTTPGFAPGPLDPLPAGASAVVCPVFEVGRPGGRLRLDLTTSAGGSPTPVELPVAAAAG